MTKAKKIKAKKKVVKVKKIESKGVKISDGDSEIIVQGKIVRINKIDIPDIYEIFIASPDYEVELELPISLIKLIEENYNFLIKEDNEIFVKISVATIKQDDAMFLGNGTVHEVRQKYFLCSIGGLKLRLINLSNNIKLFPQNVKINIGLFKTLEELKKSD